MYTLFVFTVNSQTLHAVEAQDQRDGDTSNPMYRDVSLYSVSPVYRQCIAKMMYRKRCIDIPLCAHATEAVSDVSRPDTS